LKNFKDAIDKDLPEVKALKQDVVEFAKKFPMP
jgi:hypothetical protein